MKTSKMHNFEQVRDVLDYCIYLHSELGRLYSRLSDQSEQKRVKLLLDYLMRHESNRQVAMERFEESAGPDVLNVWMQYSPSSKIEELIGACTIDSAKTVDDVIRISLAFDDAMIALYREAADETRAPEVQEMCRNLIDMQKHERQRLVRDVEWAEDM